MRKAGSTSLKEGSKFNLDKMRSPHSAPNDLFPFEQPANDFQSWKVSIVSFGKDLSLKTCDSRQTDHVIDK